jgi:hypothetical protein
MSDATVLERFIEARPLCVMTRCILGHLMTDDLDAVFAQCRQRQYEVDIKFSALAVSVADVALNFCANFNQAYKKHKEQLAASVVAYYGKHPRVLGDLRCLPRDFVYISRAGSSVAVGYSSPGTGSNPGGVSEQSVPIGPPWQGLGSYVLSAGE